MTGSVLMFVLPGVKIGIDRMYSSPLLGEMPCRKVTAGLHGHQLTSSTKKHSSLIFICTPLMFFPSLITQVKKQGLFVGYSLRIPSSKVGTEYII